MRELCWVALPKMVGDLVAEELGPERFERGHSPDRTQIDQTEAVQPGHSHHVGGGEIVQVIPVPFALGEPIW